MAAPTSTNEVTARRLTRLLTGSDGNGGLWKKVGDKVTNAIGALDVASVGGAGKYISAISETDGKISATATTMDTTPTASSTNAVTSGGVKTALDGKAPTSHASSATTYGVGTTANYGHVKLATGDMNGAAHSDGVAVSKNHTHSQYLSKEGGSMTGATRGYFLSTRDSMVGNEYNCLINAKERGALTFTQSGTGQLTEDQVWQLFDGRIVPSYSSTGIDPSDPYVLTIDATKTIGNTHTQAFAAFGWTTRYWCPVKFKVEAYNTWESKNEWVTLADYSTTAYSGQYSAGIANLFIPFGSGRANPHTGVTQSGAFPKIRITIYQGDTSTTPANRWGISEIFYCYPEVYKLYSGLHVHAADRVNATVYAGYTSDLVNASVANSDFARIRVGGANNAGYMEIATGDDGTEPIYVRQYTGANVTNQVTLLDGSGNTTFPKQVTAAGFTGPLTGNADTATSTSQVAHSGPATADMARHVWFSDSATEAKRVYNDSFKYNPVGNLLTANISGNAATATTATDYNTSSGTIKTALDGKASSSHTHGNITNGGALQTTDITIASGDKLIVTDSSDSNKVARTSVSFDGSTTTKALTQKGTFESFAKSGDITTAIQALDVSSVGGAGKYISAISETDGKINATATTMDTSPTASSTNAVTSGGVKTALDDKVSKVANTTLDNNITTTWVRYGKRKCTISGQSIAFDMSAETGNWVGSSSSLIDATQTHTLLGFYGSTSEGGLIHFYMGGTYIDPFFKITKDGIAAFKNSLRVPSLTSTDGNRTYTLNSTKGGELALAEDKLNKTTYEWNKEIAFSSTGKLCVGKFPMYDSNVTINISTTTTSIGFSGTIVIATQNINTSRGGSYSVNVFGDPTGDLSSRLKVKYSSGSRNFEVYIDFPSWSKNLIHIQANALRDVPTDIATSVDTIPDTDILPVTNKLTANFLNSVGSVTLAGGSAVKIGTQNGADVKLTITAMTDQEVTDLLGAMSA